MEWDMKTKTKTKTKAPKIPVWNLKENTPITNELIVRFNINYLNSFYIISLH